MTHHKDRMTGQWSDPHRQKGASCLLPRMSGTILTLQQSHSLPYHDPHLTSIAGITIKHALQHSAECTMLTARCKSRRVILNITLTWGALL